VRADAAAATAETATAAATPQSALFCVQYVMRAGQVGTCVVGAAALIVALVWGASRR
jgi:hypothetical protein